MYICEERRHVYDTMAIKIVAEPLMIQGEPYYLVIAIDALSCDELPVEYLAGIPAVWLVDDGICRRLVYCNTDYALCERNLYPASEFNQILDLIAGAGHRLAAINDRCPKKQQTQKLHRTFALDKTRCREFII